MLTAYALFITLMFGLQIAAIVLTVLYKVTTIYIHSIPLILLIKIVITIIMSKPITASSRPHLLKIVITTIISIIVLPGRARRTSTLATCSSPHSPRTPRRRPGMR